MTEITRVPLQPIARGALAKLWIGIAALALAAGGIAYAAMPASVRVVAIKPGTGPSPTDTDVSLINYKGMLPDGHVFDQQDQFVVVPGQVVPGFTKAIERMQRGGRYTVTIPAELAYGAQGQGPIPPNTALTFQIDLIDFKSRAEVEQQQRLIQQLQQMQAQQQGARGAGAVPPGESMPGGPPAGAEPPAPPPPAP